MSEVLIVPHPLLRQASKALNKVTKDDVKLSKKMIKIMKKAPGVGLAANQIGVLKKIVTVHIQDKEKETDKVYALFNPIIMRIKHNIISYKSNYYLKFINH